MFDGSQNPPRAGSTSRARAGVDTRGTRRAPARAPSSSSSSSPASTDSGSRWNVTVHRRSYVNWCGVFVTGIVVAGVVWGVNRLRRGPTRIEVVHQERQGDWSVRVMRIGAWSVESQAWVGRSRYDLELLGPDNAVRRHRTLIFELDEALDYAREQLSKAAGG